MPITIIRQDITKIKCDAIVDPTDINYSHTGGVDEAIHEAAGDELYRACTEHGPLKVGDAVITPAFALPSKYVIHTAGPRWKGGEHGEEALLRSCYRESLKLAEKNKFKSIAFPLISSGTFGFPKDRVLRIAVDEISQFLLGYEMLVKVVVYDKSSYSIGGKLFSDIVDYIEGNYEDASDRCNATLAEFSMKPSSARRIISDEIFECKSILESSSLDDKLKQLDESFSEMLLRKIDERGMTDAECYKKANIDRKLFSKIRKDKDYRPSKSTAIAFAISLELSREETEELLKKAGFALSRSNKFDIIIEYFISQGKYNIFEINEVLYQFDQNTLGA